MAIVKSDIEAVFGTEFVAQWSAFTGGTNPAANTARISLAIAWAESQVTQRLTGGPYTLPVLAADGSELAEIKDAKATLAGWYLWKTRGLNQAKETATLMADHYQRVVRLLRAIRCGGYPLVAAYNTQVRNTPFVV